MLKSNGKYMKLIIGMLFIATVGQFLVVGQAGATPKGGGNVFSPSYPAAYEDDPRRLEWQKPDKVIDYLLIKKGDIIADIGAGTGFFTLLFAQKIGKNGLVYAVDIDAGMVNHLEKRAVKEGFENIKGILATPNDPLLPKSSVDLIFICDTYMFIENRVQYLTRLRDSLKHNGRIAIVSFNRKAEIPGSPPPQKMISRERTIQEADLAGFALEAEYFFLPYQDFLVFMKR